VKRIIIIAGFLILGSLALAGVAQATPPSNLTSTTLGRISLGPFHESSHGFKISSRHPTDVVVLTTTINPGGSTGWHSHPGPAFIVVIRGTLTVYDGDDPTCAPHRYGPGTGFLDPGFGHAHRPQRRRDAGDRGPDLPQRATRRLPPDRRARTRQLPVLGQSRRRPADRPASAPPQHSWSVPGRLTCGRTGCSSAVTTMSWQEPARIAAILP
jgi:Cupin domain